LQSDPYSFAIIEALVSAHREAGNLQEVTHYREQLHQLYCLPEYMWQEWLQDEIMLASTEGASDEQYSRIRQLFDRALNDYQYRKVHKMRIEWELALD